MKKLLNLILIMSIMTTISCFSSSENSKSNQKNQDNSTTTETNETSENSNNLAKKILTGKISGNKIDNGTIYLKDSNGKLITTTINEDNSYEFNVKDLTAPYVILLEKVINNTTSYLYSYSTKPGKANLTPASNLIFALSIENDPKLKFIPEDVKKENFKLKDFPSLNDFDNSKKELTELLQTILKQLNISDDFDLIESEFENNGTGISEFFQIFDLSVKTSEENNLIISIKNALIEETLYEKNIVTGFEKNKLETLNMTDYTLPIILENTTVTPTKVNGEQEIKISIKARSSKGTLEKVSVFFTSPGFFDSPKWHYIDLNLKYNEENKLWEDSIKLENWHEPGKWIALNVRLQDDIGNYKDYNYNSTNSENYYCIRQFFIDEQLSTDEVEIGTEIYRISTASIMTFNLTETTSDFDAPILTSIDCTPQTGIEEQGEITVNVKAKDIGLSGIKSANVILASPNFIENGSGFKSNNIELVPFSDTWHGIYTIDKNHEPGEWKVLYIELTDNADNTNRYYFNKNYPGATNVYVLDKKNIVGDINSLYMYTSMLEITDIQVANIIVSGTIDDKVFQLN